MDPKVVTKLHDAFEKALDEPSVLDVLDRHAMVQSDKSAADYRTAVTDRIALEKQLLERIGLSKKD
jgi:tripartite-type tricarboxylate transporter receptor subunit TctC